MTQRVLVVDTNREPLMPTHPAKARIMLKSGRASVLKKYPFTIIVHDVNADDNHIVTQDTQTKVDPGAKTTGIALVSNFKRGRVCIWAAELNHRGNAIRDALEKRRMLRRGRRGRHVTDRGALIIAHDQRAGCLRRCKAG